MWILGSPVKTEQLHGVQKSDLYDPRPVHVRQRAGGYDATRNLVTNYLAHTGSIYNILLL